MIIEAISTASDLAALAATQAGLPDPAPIQPPGTEGLTAILGWARWVALAVCILGLFAAGALMAVSSRRGEGGEHVGKIGMALAGVIVIEPSWFSRRVVGYATSGVGVTVVACR